MKSWSSCLYHKIGTIPWQFVHLQYSAADLSDKKKIEFLNFTSFFSSFSFIVLLICIHFHNLILYFSFHKNAFFILLLLYIDTYTYTYTKNSSKDIGNKNETLLFPHHFTDFSCKTAKFKSFELWKKNGFLGKLFVACSSFINGSKGKMQIKLKS